MVIRSGFETLAELQLMAKDAALIIPRGFRAAGVKAGIKPSGGLDLAILAADTPCATAGTFTTNQVCAAPVRWCRELLPSDDIRAIVINAGNANAATGAEGLDNARRTAVKASALLGCRPEQVLVASTGVIGHQLPMDRLEAGLERASADLSMDPESFRTAALSIITTDTRPKLVYECRTIGGREVRLLGIAKGAAMIGPRMATMLAFLMTDAPIWANALQDILADAVDSTFNCLTVEGHASTNDTVILLSSTASTEPILAGDEVAAFAEMVRTACESLAWQIADDGEGSTHLITIDVAGCASTADARAIARAVAESALVKTAIHGADPNWGRIVSAAGYAGVTFPEEALSLEINGVAVYQAGVPVPFDAAWLSRSLRDRRAVDLRLALTLGDASARFWTCDLTAEYVRLNADYTT
jgi:glutamate N-acetyltransferase/amino-acid N-acetyltransferase